MDVSVSEFGGLSRYHFMIGSYFPEFFLPKLLLLVDYLLELFVKSLGMLINSYMIVSILFLSITCL